MGTVRQLKWTTADRCEPLRTRALHETEVDVATEVVEERELARLGRRFEDARLEAECLREAVGGRRIEPAILIEAEPH
jgi:hypothetical protein